MATKKTTQPIEQEAVILEERKLTLPEHLQKIQKELNAPKNQFNSFGKYHYRSCEDILEALKPFIDGCYVTLSDEIVPIGLHYYVKATATISDGKESISASAYARETEEKKGMDSAQVTGSTSSYARKYALNGLFLIDDNKDADHSNQGEATGEPAKSTEPKATVDQLAQVNKLLAKKNKTMDDLKYNIKTKFGKETLLDLSFEEANKVINGLQLIPDYDYSNDIDRESQVSIDDIPDNL